MTILSAPAVGDRASRVLLFVSLALNLFFLGVLGATAVRQLWLQPPAAIEPSPSAAKGAYAATGADAVATDQPARPPAIVGDARGRLRLAAGARRLRAQRQARSRARAAEAVSHAPCCVRGRATAARMVARISLRRA